MAVSAKIPLRRSLSVKGRLAILAAVSVMMAAIVGGAGYWALRSTSETAQQMATTHVALAQQAQHLNVRGLTLRRFEKDLFLNIEDPAKIKEYTGKWEKTVTEVEHTIGVIAELTSSPEDRAEVGKIRELVGVYVTAMRSLQADIAAGKLHDPAAGNKAITPFKDSIRSLEEHTGAIVKHADAELTAAQQAQEAAAARLLWLILGIGGVAMVVGLALAWRTSKILTVPLTRTVEVLEAVTHGDLSRKVAVERGDEVGRMASALNVAIDHLRRDREIITERNTSMRRVLDNVRDGLVSIDREGRVGAETSAAARTWFGDVPAGATIHEWLDRLAPDFASSFRIGWEELLADIMPRELLIDQLARHAVIGGSHYAIAYTLIEDDAKTITGALLVFTDVTAKLERERMEREQLEMVALFQRVTEDRRGALAFADELVALADEACATESTVVLKRVLHTLKGNLAVYGVDSASALCHRFEDVLADEGELSAGMRAELSARVAAVSAQVRKLAHDEQTGFHVREEDLGRLLQLVAGHASHVTIANELMRLRHEPAGMLLGRAAEGARQLAQRTGKGAIQVEVIDHGVRLESERWRPFFASLVHVGRNAVDHGVEDESERTAAKKPAQAKLVFEVVESSSDLCVKVVDDGRGIAWDRVRAASERAGVRAKSQTQLTHALFTDGITSREEVTESSGRGVGLAAVRAECERLGGHVTVESTVGVGTTFTFRFPQATKAAA